MIDTRCHLGISQALEGDLVAGAAAQPLRRGELDAFGARGGGQRVERIAPLFPKLDG